MGPFKNYMSVRPHCTQWVLCNELTKKSQYTQFLNKLSRTQVTPDQIRNLAYEVRDIKRAQASRRAQTRGLRIKLLSDKAKPPTKQLDKAAGYDLSSAQNGVIPAGSRKLIQTDLAMTVPPGTYGRITPRSGLALKHHIDIGAGVVDEDYTGPVGILMINHESQDFIVNLGDWIAQLILERISNEPVIITQELSDSSRGERGFGSTRTGQINIIQTEQENNTSYNNPSRDTCGRGDQGGKGNDDNNLCYQILDLCNKDDI